MSLQNLLPKKKLKLSIRIRKFSGFEIHESKYYYKVIFDDQKRFKITRTWEPKQFFYLGNVYYNLFDLLEQLSEKNKNIVLYNINIFRKL